MHTDHNVSGKAAQFLKAAANGRWDPVTTDVGKFLPLPTGAEPRLTSVAGVTPTGPAEIRAWQTGQLLQALVIATRPGGRAELSVAGTRVQAETAVPLHSGENLRVQVEHGTQTTVLRIVQRPASLPQVHADAMRTALPRQAAPGPLLANLQQLAANPAPARAGALADVLPAVRELIQSLPTPAQITDAEGLRQAVAHSGLFLEALAASPTPPASIAQDLKAALLRLSELLTSKTGSAGPAAPAADHQPPPMRGAPAPPPPPALPTLSPGDSPPQVLRELRSQVESALSRIQLGQLNSVTTEPGAAAAWIAEIPVRNGERMDVWTLQIEQDAAAATESRPRCWSVSLAFNLERIGSVQARVTLLGQRVSASFWAESPATLELLQEHSAALRQTLVTVGLEVGDILCHPGPAPSPPAGDRAAGLLSVTA